MGDKLFLKNTFKFDTTADLVIPILKMISFHPLIPYKIDFNSDVNKFVWKKRGIMRWFIACIWAIMMTTYISLILLSDIRGSHTTTAIVDKICWGTYTVFDVAFVICFCVNGEKIANILNSGRLLIQNELKIKGKGNDKLISKIACVAVVIFVAVFVVVIIINNLIGSTTDLYDKFMMLTGGKTGSKLDKWCEYTCNLFKRSRESAVGGMVFGTWLAVSYSIEFFWVSFLVLVTGWGIYFKRLLNKCVEGVESGDVCVMKAMRTYVLITNLLDKFNNVFGTTLLWSVLSLGLYIAFIVGELMDSGFSSMLVDGVNLLSVVPYLTMAMAAAEVHRMARKLPNSINRNGILNKYTVFEYLEVIQGASLVQYDALSNDIGFKGLGFFTISYKFIANFAGLVFTYSLVTLQFKRAESLQTAHID